jgi:Uma2 family endonuclease
MNVVLPTRMTVDEFLAWASRQEQGRFELFDGRVVMQQSEKWAHSAVKGRIYLALMRAIEGSAVPFYAATQGPNVRVSEQVVFEPDALVAPLPYPDGEALEVAAPVLVVEVLSPSTARRDLTDKLAGYFKVPSVQHYLVLDPEEREIVWYHRAAGGAIEPPSVLRAGTVHLDPPGIELAVAEVFPPQ